MIEKHIVLEDVDPVVFYGVNNVNMQMIKALYPKLRIVARGNIVKVMGDEEEMCAFEEHIKSIEEHCVKYNSLNEKDILDIIKGNKPQKESAEGVIVYSVTGKPITARSENQQKLVDAYKENDMIFCHRTGGVRKDLHQHRACGEGAEEQGNPENHPEPAGRGSGRKTGIPARRHEREDRPVPATTL